MGKLVSSPHQALPSKSNVPFLNREEEKEQQSRKKLPQGKKFGKCISSTSTDVKENLQEQTCHQEMILIWSFSNSSLMYTWTPYSKMTEQF